MGKKIIIYISIVTLFIISLICGIFYFHYDLKVISIRPIVFDLQTNQLTIMVEKKNNLFHQKFSCTVFDDNASITERGKNNTCIISFPIGSQYTLILEDQYQKSVLYDLGDYLENILDFDFTYDTIYLTVGETKQLDYNYRSVNGNVDNFTTDSHIITIDGDAITAHEVGTATIHKENVTLNVVVTDLITLPTISNHKEILPCNRYREEEGILLDQMLAHKVNEAGYQTRAGVVAAARFLTLEFPYKIPYFYENGRVNYTGVNFADGEGRYYHKGLYLIDSKKQEIIASISGPSLWGCPLTNWEDDPDFGFVWGAKKPNGLDCSGFVSWVLYNGGFDVGDLGAGDSITDDELTDLGDFRLLTKELVNSGSIKVGDLFNYWGHIAIIVGMDHENYYVAESLQNFGGVVVNTYKKSRITDEFTHVELMDSYYKEDGNYTTYWK